MHTHILWRSPFPACQAKTKLSIAFKAGELIPQLGIRCICTEILAGHRKS